MKTIYLDCSMGAAGDMLTAALLELHEHPEAVLDTLNRAFDGKAVLSVRKDQKCGISGSHVTVTIDGQVEGEEHPHSYDAGHNSEHSQDGGHLHEYEHHHDHDHVHPPVAAASSESAGEAQSVGGDVADLFKNGSITVKIDGSTTTPMPGVHFEIHRQITVGGVTSFDLNPMPGFEDLMSDVEGVIPGLDDRLPPGTYQLREKETPEGYEELSKHTVFKVSETGYITLIENDPAVELSQESGEADQSIEYILTVKNMKPGIELPSTGGVGTRLIYLLGALMVAFAAAASFIRRRRREAL